MTASPWWVMPVLLALALPACSATHHGAGREAPGAPVGVPTAPAATPTPAASPAAQMPGAAAGEASLVTRGEAGWRAYQCYECHGAHGEGTDDAPDLTGTRLNAEEIARFLQKPSNHARSTGMPSVSADSPDLQPLVAFVLSLKRPR